MFLLSRVGLIREKGNKKDLRPQRKPLIGLISWDKSLKTSAVPPKLTISCPLMTRLHASSPVTVGLRQRLLALAFSLPSAVHSANVFLLRSHHPAALWEKSCLLTRLHQRFHLATEYTPVKRVCQVFFAVKRKNILPALPLAKSARI